jgi:hypothetical protein
MPPIHKDLVAGRWTKLTLPQQLANIGSEVSRMAHWRESGDEAASEDALKRALELVDLTLAGLHVPARALEIAQLREALCAAFLGTREYDIPMKRWKTTSCHSRCVPSAKGTPKRKPASRPAFCAKSKN